MSDNSIDKEKLAKLMSDGWSWRGSSSSSSSSGSTDDDCVKSVNGILPDESGDVQCPIPEEDELVDAVIAKLPVYGGETE